MSLPAWRTEIIHFLDFVSCMHAFSCASFLSVVRTLFREFQEFRHPWNSSKTADNIPLDHHSELTTTELCYLFRSMIPTAHIHSVHALPGPRPDRGTPFMTAIVFAYAVHPDYERIEKFPFLWRMCWNVLRTRKAFRMQPWLPNSLPSYARLAGCLVQHVHGNVEAVVLSVKLKVAKKAKRIMDKRTIQLRSQRVKRQTSQNARRCECQGCYSCYPSFEVRKWCVFHES